MSTINRKEDEIVVLDLQKTRLEQSILGLQQGNLRKSNGSQNENILTNDVLIQLPTEYIYFDQSNTWSWWRWHYNLPEFSQLHVVYTTRNSCTYYYDTLVHILIINGAWQDTNLPSEVERIFCVCCASLVERIWWYGLVCWIQASGKLKKERSNAVMKNLSRNHKERSINVGQIEKNYGYRSCSCCGLIFLANIPNKKYCSPDCLSKVYKKRYSGDWSRQNASEKARRASINACWGIAKPDTWKKCW